MEFLLFMLMKVIFIKILTHRKAPPGTSFVVAITLIPRSATGNTFPQEGLAPCPANFLSNR